MLLYNPRLKIQKLRKDQGEMKDPRKGAYS
jgi:hypothetical protein